MSNKGEHTGEAKKKYDFTEAYRESIKKAAAYTKEDWAEITKRGTDMYSYIASLMDKGPNDPQVQKAMTDWRKYITDSFFNCTRDLFQGMADVYLKDKRFTESLDKTNPGLANFMGDAIKIHCNRPESE